MLDEIVYLVTQVFLIYSISRFMTAFFGKAVTPWYITVGSFVLYFFIHTSMFLIFKNTIINVCVNLIGYFLLSFNYNVKLKTKIIGVLCLYAILSGIDFLVYWGFHLPFVPPIGEAYILAISQVIIAILVFLIVLVLSNICGRMNGAEVSLLKWVSTISIPLATLVVLLIPAIAKLSVDLPFIFAMAVIMLFINVIVFYLYDELAKAAQVNLDKTLAQEHNTAYQKQLNLVYSAQNSINTFRHDMKNHFSVLRTYIIEDNKQEALKYLDSAFEAVQGKLEYCKSGNYVIDSILNLKAGQAESSGIRFDLKVSIPHHLKIKPFDLNVIIGNIIDNAIKASLEVNDPSKRHICVKLSYDMTVLYITVTNTYEGRLKGKGGSLMTSKVEEGHGIGLDSVEHSLQKYNGEMKFICDDKFHVKIILFDID